MEIFDDSLPEVSESTGSFESLICDLLDKESLRYVEQAKELLSAGSLNIRCGKVLIKYKISGDQFCYQFKNKIDGSLQESEILALDLYEDQIATLKFIFAESEAAVNR